MTDLTDRLRATGIEACEEYAGWHDHRGRLVLAPDYRLRQADACIAALLDRIEFLKDEFSDNDWKHRAERAEAEGARLRKFNESCLAINEAKTAEVARLHKLWSAEAAKNFQYEAEKAQPGMLLEEVARLRWMLRDAAGLDWESSGPDEMMTDLAARYEKERDGT